MRKGNNPTKDLAQVPDPAPHVVVIPLYIPEMDGYYKDALKVFETCLESLVKTKQPTTEICVVANGCCETVTHRLSEYHKKGWIQDLFLLKEGVGKINALLKALRSLESPFVTLTDADVLFLNDWEKAVYEVFEAFPKAAAVSPTPIFGTQARLTYPIWKDYFFSKKLQFLPVADPEAMTRFVQSIGWPRLDRKYKEVILGLKSTQGVKAVVGCNHMTVTYKTSVFRTLPKGNSPYLLGGDSEFEYLDKPPVLCDGYRLATYQNYSYHMGNAMEPWMQEVFSTLKTPADSIDFRGLPKSIMRPRPFVFFLKQKLLGKIFGRKSFRKWFYRNKGLQKNQMDYFFS